MIEGLVRRNWAAKNTRLSDYRFEIERTTDGPVTEKCVLTDGKVIA